MQTHNNKDLSQEVTGFVEKLPWPVALDVGFCFYETSISTVKRSIESVKDHVRFIFAIDGKYEFFESDEPLSGQPVREYLRSIPNVILIDCPNKKENEKRQEYILLCQELVSDFLLILDADEYMTDECDWDKAYAHMRQLHDHTKEPKIMGVTMRHGKKESNYPRLWLRPFLIEYTKTHNFWKFITDGSIWKSQITFPPVTGMFMKGDDKDRHPNYVKKTYEYQLKLMEYEKPFKEQYRKIAKNVSSKYIDNRLPGIPLS